LAFFYDEDSVDVSTVHCWMRKSRDSGRNLDLNDQLLPGRPVTTTHNLNKQEVNELIQENEFLGEP
jgi:hypothetical protein